MSQREKRAMRQLLEQDDAPRLLWTPPDRKTLKAPLKSLPQRQLPKKQDFEVLHIDIPSENDQIKYLFFDVDSGLKTLLVVKDQPIRSTQNFRPPKLKPKRKHRSKPSRIQSLDFSSIESIPSRRYQPQPLNFPFYNNYKRP